MVKQEGQHTALVSFIVW